MPYASSTCVTTASSTQCDYYQSDAIIHTDPALTVVLGAILLVLVANLTRNAFFR